MNNFGIFEPKSVRGHCRRRMGPLLRGERAQQRGAPRAALSAGDAARELGPHHLHLQRKRRADPSRDDPLRHDQDGGAARCLAGTCRSGRGQTGITVNSVLPGHDKSRRRRDEFVEALAKTEEASRSRHSEKEFFRKRCARPRSSSDSPAPAEVAEQEWSAYLAEPVDLRRPTEAPPCASMAGSIKSAFSIGCTACGLRARGAAAVSPHQLSSGFWPNSSGRAA